MNIFTCPVCKGKLSPKGKSYCCKKGHSFDCSASGYIHLLPANKMRSKIPGDNKEMVNARRSFLHKGYYEPISEGMNRVVGEELLRAQNVQPTILDVGCGEGYYTTRLYESLTEHSIEPELCGMDISKIAVNAAAKSSRDILWAVGSSFDLPIRDSCCDVLISMFAPICIDEFRRVLKKQGVLVFAVASTKHLWELKEAIYDEPYENKKVDHTYEGFTFERKEKVHTTIHLPSQEDISNLFTMTPYYYKSSVQTAEKVHALTQLDTQIEVDILIYRKN